MTDHNEQNTKLNFIEGGYILLARKLRSSKIMESPPLVMKLWVWMLLEASYKDHGDLKRGQFFTKLRDIQRAMSYKVGFRTVRPTIKEIRGAMKILMKSHMMGTMKVTHGQVITIQNYDFYQNPKNYEGQYEGRSEGLIEGTILRIKGIMNEKKDPSAISEEIASLSQKMFPEEDDLYSGMIKAISSTRKAGRVSPNVILSLLKSLEKFPQEKIQAGIRIYLEKEYYREGKKENYLLGIIRNHRPRETRPPQEINSTGSRLLDAYYKKQTGQGVGQ